MFQRSHNFTSASPRCSLQRTLPTCFSVAWLQVLSANKTGWVPGVARAACMYRLYNTGARTELWVTPADIFLDIENSPSTKTLNFLSVRKEAIALMSLFENCNSYNLYGRPECRILSKAFPISKNTVAVHRYCRHLGWRDPLALHIEVFHCEAAP
jgi:hypothetical protein